MKARNIHLGETYEVKVGGKLTPVRIVGSVPHGGWHGTSLTTGRDIRLKSGRRVRCNVTLRDAARAYYAARAAGPFDAAAPGALVASPAGRKTIAGDYDGTEFA